jgi:hypothetical protein
MTKTHVLTRGRGRDHIANLHIRLGDDDTVNKEFYELPSLLPGGLLEAALHSGAEGFDRLHEPGHIVLPLGFCRELIFLARQRLKALLQPLAPPLILLQRHHLVEVGVREALYLVAHAGLTLPELGTARRQVLRQPGPCLRLFQRLGETRRVRQHVTEILPHQRIQLAGGSKPCGAFLGETRAYGRKFAIAPVGGVIRAQAPTGTGEMALPTTHQRAHQGGMHGIVPCGGLLVLRQLCLDLVKLLRTDQRGDGGHGDPGGGRHGRLGRHPLGHLAER